MRGNNRKSIEKCRKKLPQFTTMNVIDGQAGLVIYSSLIFYSLTIDNILNIIVLLILAGVSIAMLTGDNGILIQASKAKEETINASKEEEIKILKQEDFINEYISEIEVEHVIDQKPGRLEIDKNDENIAIINSIEDLIFFAYDVTNGNNYEGKTIKLGLSLDFNSNKSYVNALRTDYSEYGYNGELKTLLNKESGFKPIGNDNSSFTGIFDGNNNKLVNLYINTNSEKNLNKGLFSKNEGIIKNLKILNCNIIYEFRAKSKGHLGGIAGYNKGKIINCSVNGRIEGKILDSNNSNLRIGGVTGYNYGNIEMCENYANIVAIANDKNLGEINIGGISGSSNGGEENNTGSIIDCNNSGEIYSESNLAIYIGGITGVGNRKIQNCINTGKIKARTQKRIYAGGIVGSGGSSEISDSENKGDIEAIVTNGDYCYVGGIVGYGINSKVTNSSNYGSLFASKNGENYETGDIIGVN